MSLSKIEADRSILTSAVETTPAVSSQAISDQTTIRNAVSSANLDELSGKPLAWANVDTQSRGSIFDVVETRKKDVLCRRFRTSRESFDGVAIYAGEACLGRDGAWYMRAFSQS